MNLPLPAPPDAPAAEVLAALWRDAGLPPAALDRVHLSGGDEVLRSSFRLATALQAALAAAALAAAEIGRLRGGPAQNVGVDAADVALEASGRFTVDGRTPNFWDKLSGLYRCDGGAEPGWVRLHANFEHHRDGALALLGLPPGAATERAAVAEALRGWSAEAFEEAAAARGLVVARVRSPQQWQRHAQAAATAAQPLVAVERIGDAPARPWPPLAPAQRPLQGLRVLDLTRILAGPVAGRTLAAYGAEVMLINGPQLPNIESIADTSRGKLSAHLDLKTAAGRAGLHRLLRDADVFLQGYRPGAIAAFGFGPAELARERPGIVVLSLSAYGDRGPWAQRRGFDSLVQSATGLNVAEAEAFGSAEPRALPLQALDYGAGFLLAFGAGAALVRQRAEGGSWRVSVSLAGVGRWLAALGRVAVDPQAGAPPQGGAMEESDSGFGRLCAPRHAARLSHTPAAWTRPSMPPGSHPPEWPAG